MNYIDVFNGDADGICALIQLRLFHPAQSELVTGVKRDIELLQRVKVTGSSKLTVLDISMAKNSAALNDLLTLDIKVLYIDHHYAGKIPQHKNLNAIIDPAANTCTSLIMNDHLEGAHKLWALVGAFGDNMDERAILLGKHLDLSDKDLGLLCDLGRYINYNSYGVDLEDLYFSPDILYTSLLAYQNPLTMIEDCPDIFNRLQDGYRADMAQIKNFKPSNLKTNSAVYILPTEKWASRVSGVWGNHVANEFPNRAHAIISRMKNGDYRVSVRAPLNRREGADTLCSAFATGGGRAAAAGINALPVTMLDDFIHKFQAHYA